MTSDERVAVAEKLFREGNNCAQAVFCAYADKFGMSFEHASRMACGLGGGVGRMRQVCGAVSAASLLIGLCHGNDKNVVYPIVQDFCRLFKQEASSIVCKELLSGQKCVEVGGAAESRTDGYYKSRPCVELVKLSVRILEEKLS